MKSNGSLDPLNKNIFINEINMKKTIYLSFLTKNKEAKIKDKSTNPKRAQRTKKSLETADIKYL